jgi:integral membrane protein (TIGR00529 family)
MIELSKIGFVFFSILLLTYKKVNLWISLLVGTFLLGFLFHLSLQMILTVLFTSVLDRKTLLLLGALVFILLFSSLLKETGRMKEILEGFRTILKDVRIVIALLPAMIGLMPIMGGALVSAPMVVEGSDELKLSPERRTFINYWFRHIWEYVVPTYPALILATALIGIPIRRFGWMNLPLTLTAIVTGTLAGFWGIPASQGVRERANPKTGWRLFGNLFPLLFALLLVIVLKVELAYAFGVTVLGMIFLYRIKGQLIFKAIKESLNRDLLLTVAIVMGFKGVLESSQAIRAVSVALSSSGIPLWLIAVLIPMLIGVMTGVTFAPIAIGFPILIPLFQKDPHFLNYMMLAFAAAISGDLLSPFHLCLILTKDYFRADLKGVYRLMWLPVIFLLTVALLMTFFR